MFSKKIKDCNSIAVTPRQVRHSGREGYHVCCTRYNRPPFFKILAVAANTGECSRHGKNNTKLEGFF